MGMYSPMTSTVCWYHPDMEGDVDPPGAGSIATTVVLPGW
ncbi:hypothetical protein KPATCC21470_5675 [Kitasatospora purpeofusca]